MTKNTLFLLLFCFLIWGCDSAKKEEVASSENKSQNNKPSGFSPPPVQVEVSTVQERPFEIKVSILGSTLPYQRTSVSSSIAGKVIKNNIELGKKYKKGDVLIELDEYAWKASLREKEAECERWKIEIEKLKNGNLPEEIAEKKANLEEKQVQLQKLALEKERARNLINQNNLAASEWDNVRFLHEGMKAQVKRAEAELALMERGWRTEDVEIAKKNLEKSIAIMEQTKDNLEKSIIRAPFSGVITKKQVEIGEWLVAGDIVAELIDLSQIKIELAISEKYISLVKLGMSAYVTVDAIPGALYEGKVIEIVPSSQGAARNFPVYLLIPNKNNQIMEGMFCRVEGILRESTNVLMVHRDAFIHRGSETLVARVTQENKIEYVTISTGERKGEWFEILTATPPLKNNDKVIITNNNQVYPGANVIIVNEKQL